MPAALPSRTTGVRGRLWTAGRFLLLLTALGVTFGAFFLAGIRVANRTREVAVPDLIGRSVGEATRVLAERGLALRVDELRRPDAAIPADHVLSQDPAPGLVVRRQRTVRVRLSDGERRPVVPSVIDMPERTAEIALAGDQIDIASRAEVRSAEYRPGAVIAQDPPARARGRSVHLLVNRADGTMTYVVPDLIGTLGIRAADVLRGLGFRVSVAAEVPYPGIPPGVVVRQTPQPGYRIGPGDPIALEVSR